MRQRGVGEGQGLGQTEDSSTPLHNVSPFVFMPMLSRVNGKDQWQIIIGRVDSGSSGRGPETGFVSI